MSFNPQHDQQSDEIISEINVTPLIDIMLVLLIIFMVTSSIATQSGIGVELPGQKSSGQEISPQKFVFISLNKNGELFLQGKPLPEAELAERLRLEFAKQNEAAVIIEGDRASQLEKIVSIMDTATSAGAKQISIATTQE